MDKNIFGYGKTDCNVTDTHSYCNGYYHIAVLYVSCSETHRNCIGIRCRYNGYIIGIEVK